MTLNLGALDGIKTAAKPAKKKVEWEPLNLASLTPGIYVAADQSLTATGIVVLYVGAAPRIMYATTLKTDPVATGWEDTLQRAQRMEALMAAWLADTVLGAIAPEHPRTFIVHEAPPIGGGRMINPEVSLISALAWRNATKRLTSWTLLPMVRRQDHAKLICGNGNAKKPDEHAALKLLLPGIEGSGLITNESHRDSLCVALTAAHRMP